jgi:hypothetical protein
MTWSKTIDEASPEIIPRNAWIIGVGSEADKQLREAWRQACQMGISQEVAAS